MPRKYDRNRICDLCGATFEGYPGKPRGKNTYCSKDCRLKAMSIRNRTTQRVNKPGGLTFEERTKIRNERLGKGAGESYTKYYGRHEHRVVAEEMIGRPLRAGEVVHHIDHNRRNNNPENLMVFPSQADHMFWEHHCE
ncbi:HNH endonuclease signature motif containing protein [Enterococcus timonensis]|uniref:HNH endonuclease signature motif containing protein n=1 Tax=Enterococcus timonensis TaxID=1852364 RepID=UPI0008DA78C0|nr:HNH endonuclease signature motif containing protein [Enterococcus timonensis]